MRPGEPTLHDSDSSGGTASFSPRFRYDRRSTERWPDFGALLPGSLGLFASRTNMCFHKLNRKPRFSAHTASSKAAMKISRLLGKKKSHDRISWVSSLSDFQLTGSTILSTWRTHSGIVPQIGVPISFAVETREVMKAELEAALEERAELLRHPANASAVCLEPHSGPHSHARNYNLPGRSACSSTSN